MEQEIGDQIDPPGMRDARARAYEHVLLNGPTDGGELVRAAAADPGTAQAAVAQLQALRLLRPVPGRPGVLEAVGPLAAESQVVAPLQDEVTALQRRLLDMRSRLGPLQRVHDEVMGRRADPQALVPLAGPREITDALEAAARSCEDEVLTAQPGGPRSEEVLEQALPRDTAMLSRGVRMRTIYQHSARFSGPTQAYVERVSPLGCEVRTLDEFFPRLIVFDRRTAFIPDAEEDSRAVLVRHPAVVAFLTDSFDRAWSSALPFASAHESRADKAISTAMQRSIARLMLTEDKDSSIARRLGIGERTCRAHIARIMQQLGARNRTHLGYLLAAVEPRILEPLADEPAD